MSSNRQFLNSELVHCFYYEFFHEKFLGITQYILEHQVLILPKAEGFNSQPLAFLLVLVGPSPFSTIMVSPYSPTAVCNVCIIIRLLGRHSLMADLRIPILPFDLTFFQFVPIFFLDF